MHGAIIAAATLGAWAWAHAAHAAEASTMAFMTLAFAQLFHLGTARSHSAVLSPSRIVANRWALVVMGLVIALQVMTIYVPVLRVVLHTVPLDAPE